MRFRIGLNYWPASTAMSWWKRFDPAEVASDFGRIRDAGFDSIRVFLLWEDFQPTPDLVSARALEDLQVVADTASRHELSLIVTLFTGHMSGANWIPHWALRSGGSAQRFRVVSGGKVVQAELLNWYSDETVLEAQVLQARDVASVLHAHPALWAYDLGNENSNCVVPPNRASALRWLKAISGAIRGVDRVHPITMGLHMEDLEEDRQLGPSEAAQVCDFLCMHGYPIYADWATGPTDELLLPFLGCITRWLGDRDVLFEEFGAATLPKVREGIELGPFSLLEEEVAARYTERALQALRRFGFSGALLWCYSDYREALWKDPPLDLAAHERFFGLWRNDGSAKPAVQAVTELAGKTTLATFGEDPAWIDIPKSDFYVSPRNHLRRLYQKFREHLPAEELSN